MLRRLQLGESLALPHSRPMPAIGARCHELRMSDPDASWRVVYRIDHDAIVVADVFRKTTRIAPASVISECSRRLRAYDRLSRDEE